MKTAVILGAGFSKNSGVPLAAEVPAELVTQVFEDSFDMAVSKILKRFMEEVFGCNGKNTYPSLDDMLTFIDLSTSSGHHLGIDYPPIRLRALRRLLMYRISAILNRSIRSTGSIRSLVKLLDPYNTSFVVLNWDTVLESCLLDEYPGYSLDYCNKSIMWGDAGCGKNEKIYEDKVFHIAKVHGSDNWVYCDNCRELFYYIGNAISPASKAGLRQEDFSLFKEFEGVNFNTDDVVPLICPRCEDRVSSHIATFSYRKTFRANSFPDIWSAAESMLSGADRWVFIGYSMPEADYEFKHLLKISELKLRHRKSRKIDIHLVTLNSDITVSKYMKLFGESLVHVFKGGVEAYIDFLS